MDKIAEHKKALESELDRIAERVVEGVQNYYIALHSEDEWDRLSLDERFDVARFILEKYYNADLKLYKI